MVFHPKSGWFLGSAALQDGRHINRSLFFLGEAKSPHYKTCRSGFNKGVHYGFNMFYPLVI